MPYKIVLCFIVKTSQIFWKVQVWPRHSYVLGSFIPVKSDLDLSVYIENPKTIKNFILYYNLLKKIIPFLGELALYTPETINYIKQTSFNGFELERDPLLIEKFNIDIKKSVNFNRENAFTYLLMALINDFHKLKKNSKGRYKKWQQHFTHIKLSLVDNDNIKDNLELNPELLLFSIFSALIILAPKTQNSLLLRTYLRMYIELLLDDNLEDRDRWLRPLISDSKTHFYVFFVEYLCHVEAQRPQIELSEFKLVIAQIDWFLLKMLKHSFNIEQIHKDLKRIACAEADLKSFAEKFPEYIIDSTLQQISLARSILTSRA